NADTEKQRRRKRCGRDEAKHKHQAEMHYGWRKERADSSLMGSSEDSGPNRSRHEHQADQGRGGGANQTIEFMPEVQRLNRCGHRSSTTAGTIGSAPHVATSEAAALTLPMRTRALNPVDQQLLTAYRRSITRIRSVVAHYP